MSDNGLGFNFEPLDFGEMEFPEMDFDSDFLEMHENRYINPKPIKDIPEKLLKFSNAEKLAKNVEMGVGSRSHVLLSGNFIFGDFIEALFYDKVIHTKKLSISTLSLNQENIDSLKNLINGGWVDDLELIVSDYFHAHEKRSLIPYLLEKLDIDNRFQLAISAIHTKIALFETDGGKQFVIHGSANLRSSACLEMVTIEENRELFSFCSDFHKRIIDKYSIIQKSIRNNRLWQTVVQEKVEKGAK